MGLVYELRRRARQILPQVLFACVFGYFAYHAVQGDRGIKAWLQLTQELKRTQGLHGVLEGERAGLENRVQMLRSEHMDPDLLDERARLLLGLGEPGDLVVILPGPLEDVEKAD